MENANSITINIWANIITGIIAIAASSGFWSFVIKKAETKDVKNRLLIGLAHDRIQCLCMTYIRRGYITKDEYENLDEYLYKPYIELGGNGTVQRMKAEVDKLPIRENRRLVKG